MINIPIYVVSVKSFSERHDHIKRLASKFGFSFEFVFEFDADELTEQDWRMVSSELNANCASTVLKHIECQRRLVRSRHNIALVFEDDVVLFEGFVENLSLVLAQVSKLDPGWLVFLGGADGKIDKRFHCSGELRLVPKAISTAEAYLIDREGAEKRLSFLEGRKLQLPADHELRFLDETLDITQFWISKPLVTQGSILGLFKTSLDKSRAKHSAFYLNLKYRWNRFRRQTLPRFFWRIL